MLRRPGLNRETVYDIFEAGAAGAPYVKYKREAFLRPGEVPVAFSLELVAKDQEAHPRAGSSGGDANGPSRGVTAAGRGSTRGRMGERDISEVAEFLRRP